MAYWLACTAVLLPHWLQHKRLDRSHHRNVRLGQHGGVLLCMHILLLMSLRFTKVPTLNAVLKYQMQTAEVAYPSKQSQNKGDIREWRELCIIRMQTSISLSSAVHHNITHLKREVCMKRQPLYSLRFALSLVLWIRYASAVKWGLLLEGIHSIMWPITYDAVTWVEVGTGRR